MAVVLPAKWLDFPCMASFLFTCNPCRSTHLWVYSPSIPKEGKNARNFIHRNKLPARILLMFWINFKFYVNLIKPHLGPQVCCRPTSLFLNQVVFLFARASDFWHRRIGIATISIIGSELLPRSLCACTL